MAVVSLVETPRGWFQRMAFRTSRKQLDGTVADPIRAAAHNNGVLAASAALETVVSLRWKTLDTGLRDLVQQASAMAVGCSWCVDFGYFMAIQEGGDPRKVTDVARWRESDVYDERERLVLEYAEAVCATPAALTEDLAERLRAAFTEAEIVELAGRVALENMRSRFNAGLGLVSQGFKERCELTPAGAEAARGQY